MFLLALVLPVLIDPAFCRQQSAGPARWQSDGRGTLTISTESKFVGEVVLRCKVSVPEGTKAVMLELDHSEISFQPAGSRETGSGIVIEAGGARLEILRVAGEDWIQTPRRFARIPVHGRSIAVVVRLIDNSPSLPVRVDLKRLRLSDTM